MSNDFSTTFSERRDVLNLAEAAVFLGVAQATLKHKCAAGEIPYRRIGRRYLFSRAALFQWLTVLSTEK